MLSTRTARGVRTALGARWDAQRERWGARRWRLLDAVAGSVRHGDAAAVALTFDDGPHPGSTDRVLDALARLDVRATFFCVGRNALAHPELLRRIRAEGHAVGSHSFSHPDPERTGLRALEQDYRRGRAAVAEALGADVTLFRPPRGYLDLTRAWQLRRMGWWRPVLWSVDPQDWHPDATRAGVAAVAGQAGAGQIVLLHDWVEQPWGPGALDRSATVTALDDVVAAVRSRGLGFTRVGD